jgi:hypothetical protein
MPATEDVIPMVDYLKTRFQEPEPEWLQLADRLDSVESRRSFLQGFLRSRIVYYPGACSDGQPVKLFNLAHAAHAYVYVDQWMERDALEREMTPVPHSRRYGFRGYRKMAVLDLNPSELVPGPLQPHVRLDEVWNSFVFVRNDQGYAALFVYERLPDFGEDHGAKRFALLYLKADGYAAYDALFCQQSSIARPFCVVVQDHAFGGNWSHWSRGGMLEVIARRAGVLPQLLLVADHASTEWRGYRSATLDDIPVRHVYSGSAGLTRRLFELNDAPAHPFFFYRQWPALWENLDRRHRPFGGMHWERDDEDSPEE